MLKARQYSMHYEEKRIINASKENIFAYADNHANLSAHMNKSSWMMAGSSMNTHTDNEKFQQIGSRLKMEGKVLGIHLFLDEAITKYDPPNQKEWETLGDINLLVIDHYRLGFHIVLEANHSKIMVYIDYNLPKSLKTYLLGVLFGKLYAKWCVRQMINSLDKHFSKPSLSQ